jgi:hypothetical protein
MKRILLSVAVLMMIFGATLLTSCTKDDTTAPVITITGDNPLTITLGGTYTEQGATADDDVDGNLTTSIVTDNTTVNTSLKGTYYVSYTVSDAAGNTATEKRTVNVVNSVQNMDGAYSASDDWNADGTVEYTWTETITSSSTVNNQLVFSKFANYTGCALKVNVSGSSLSYPGTQTFMCGAAGAQQNRTFTINSGTITATTLSINYYESDADGFTTTGVDAFVKQ